MKARYWIAGALALAGGLATSLVTRAAEFEAGLNKTVHGRCHMDYCGFSIIRAAVPVATLPHGTLFAISADAWGAYYNPADQDGGSEGEYDRPPIKTDPKKSVIYMVFCSKSRPYIFGYYDGKWDATPLRPGDDMAITGADESSYSDYWAACHHFFPKFATDPLVSKLAPKLGYHFSGGVPESQPDDHIAQPSDLLKESR